MNPRSGSRSALALASLIALAFALAAAGPAQAKTKITPAISTSIGYDDNVLNDEFVERGSGFTRLHPKFVFERKSETGKTAFELGGTGRVRGDLHGPRVAMAEGAYLKGKVRATSGGVHRYRERRR